ncbi:MAG: COP23 domain-containing protein [Microcoleaceae cyanobacterium MO_207.B10]|nr:COP23 domain-containing protein [Microcoleaceae cyanobacterium MO_207.B10]
MNIYLSFIVCAGLLTCQLPTLTAQALVATVPKPEILVAQENAPENTKRKTSPQPVNNRNTGYSRRQAIKYRFECNSNNQTVLAIYQARRNRRGNIVSSWEKITERPLIQWTKEGSAEFGEELTPEDRCQGVTANFNYHFLRTESRPRLPPLSEGTVNGRAVVCAAPEETCNQNNVLWTLRSNNKDTNGKIIKQLLSALRGEASSQLIMESQDEAEIEISSINMENLIDAIIDQESTKIDAEN